MCVGGGAGGREGELNLDIRECRPLSHVTIMSVVEKRKTKRCDEEEGAAVASFQAVGGWGGLGVIASSEKEDGHYVASYI